MMGKSPVVDMDRLVKDLKDVHIQMNAIQGMFHSFLLQVSVFFKPCNLHRPRVMSSKRAPLFIEEGVRA